MRLTIERVAVLSGVPMFADVPSEALAPLAQNVDELPLDAGATIIAEGDLDDCLYIVVEGAVRVHRGARDIARVGPGGAVGELSLLDPQPRSASVTTTEESLLFRLDKDSFNEIMADRPEITDSVIRALCRRVRELTPD